MVVKFWYSIFGLRLGSNRPLLDLVALPAPSWLDVQVWFELIPPWLNDMITTCQEPCYASDSRDEQGRPSSTWWKLADGAYFLVRYRDGTQFIIDRCGTRIWATWPDSLTLADTVTYLVGPILGYVLRLRGVTCLHASAVAVGGHAMALLGPAGAGKSTTAAICARLGYPVLTDDILALADLDDIVLAQPGYPRLRLWSESVTALYGSGEALPRITPTWEKRHLDLTQDGYQFQHQPLPLAAVYLLGERRCDPAAPSIEAIPAPAGLMALVTNTYTNDWLGKAMRAREFELLGRLMTRIPVRRVTPHADPAYLSRLGRVILDDVQALAPSVVS